MATLLERTTEIPDSLISLDQTLATRAYTELHYRPLTDRLNKETAQLHLYQTLKAHDISFFGPRSVERYKNRKTSPAIQGWTGVISLAITLGAVSYALVYSSAIAFGVTILALIPTIGGFVWMERRTRLNWHRCPLSDYPEPVPAFALQTALQVKAILPSASLYVDVLKLAERTSDPFLLVKYNNAEVYLEVWDEPTFEAERKNG